MGFAPFSYDEIVERRDRKTLPRGAVQRTAPLGRVRGPARAPSEAGPALRQRRSAERRLRRRARAGPLRNLFRCARLFRQEYGVPFPRRYEAG